MARLAATSRACGSCLSWPKFHPEKPAVQVVIVFPFSTGYAAETSTGIVRVWTYDIEF